MVDQVHTFESGARLHYVEKGSGEVVLFVHGIWANHVLWEGVIAALPDGVRAIAPDWPLGSQPEAFPKDADLSPDGLVEIICEFMEALDLQDVTLVGNDSGGGICQLLITSENPAAKRVGRLVLTNSDVFDQFPPKGFLPMQTLARWAPWIASPLFKRLMSRDDYKMFFDMTCATTISSDIKRRILGPFVNNAQARRDSFSFLVGCKPEMMLEATTKFSNFWAPVLLIWGEQDQLFPVELAENLTREFKDVRLVRIPGASLFVSLDDPGRVAQEIASFIPSSSP
jgi:pimeloyl-ACP methyl ester carboxylesterase